MVVRFPDPGSGSGLRMGIRSELRPELRPGLVHCWLFPPPHPNPNPNPSTVDFVQTLALTLTLAVTLTLLASCGLCRVRILRERMGQVVTQIPHPAGDFHAPLSDLQQSN